MLEKINIDEILHIARRAGKATLEIYRNGFHVEKKKDHSPITEADRKANKIIIEGLLKHYPTIPYISEETEQPPYEERRFWSHFWLIDPLDGTKEFIKKNGEFTINIALIEGQLPVLGVIYIPVKETFYFAQKGKGSFKIVNESTPQVIHASLKTDRKELIIVGSRSHGAEALNAYIEKQKMKFNKVQVLSAGSSLKFCLVAEGKADVYPRTGPTFEWDTAAGQAIVLESGKAVYEFKSGKPLLYNKENLLNSWFVVR